jgi:anti-anti-sigma factor
VGIGEIVRTYMLVTSRGGKLALCDVAARVRDVIETTQLDSVLKMFDSEAEALEMTSGADRL